MYERKEEVIKVNGIAGAKAYPMHNNSSILLMDISEPIIYLCMTDDSGKRTIKKYIKEK